MYSATAPKAGTAASVPAAFGRSVVGRGPRASLLHARSSPLRWRRRIRTTAAVVESPTPASWRLRPRSRHPSQPSRCRNIRPSLHLQPLARPCSAEMADDSSGVGGAGGTNADAAGVKSSAARMTGVVAVPPETAAVKVILAPVPVEGVRAVGGLRCGAADCWRSSRRLGGLELHMRSTSTKLVVESSTPFRWMNTSLPILNYSPTRVAGESAVASCCDESAIGCSDVSTAGGSTRLPQRCSSACPSRPLGWSGRRSWPGISPHRTWPAAPALRPPPRSCW